MKSVLAILVLLAGSVLPASAQSSSLTGIVRDGSSAVVSGSTIVVRQQGSAFEKVVESGRDGTFTISPVADREYTVEVIAPGFAVLVSTVRVPAAAPIELSLTPAPVVEEVQVVTASRQDELRETPNTNVSVISRRTWKKAGRRLSPSCCARCLA